MATFNLTTFIIDFVEIAPSLVSGVLQLKNETGSVSKTQLASDALHTATGIASALTSSNPTVQAEAQAASSIVNSFVQAVANATKQSVQ